MKKKFDSTEYKNTYLEEDIQSMLHMQNKEKIFLGISIICIAIHVYLLVVLHAGIVYNTISLGILSVLTCYQMYLFMRFKKSKTRNNLIKRYYTFTFFLFFCATYIISEMISASYAYFVHDISTALSFHMMLTFFISGIAFLVAYGICNYYMGNDEDTTRYRACIISLFILTYFIFQQFYVDHSISLSLAALCMMNYFVCIHRVTCRRILDYCDTLQEKL